MSEAEKDTREWTAMDSLRSVRDFLQRHAPTDDKEQGEWLARWLDEVEVALTAALEERDALRRLVAELANGDFASHEWEEWTADLRRRAVAVLAANP